MPVLVFHSPNLWFRGMFPFVIGEVSGGGSGASLYFRKAHSKSEVVRQPLSLKGGVLKEYQLQGLQWMVRFCLYYRSMYPSEPCFGKCIDFVYKMRYVVCVHVLASMSVLAPTLVAVY